MFDDLQVMELRLMAVAVDKLRASTQKPQESAYYQGGRDILLGVANLYEKRCPLAVMFFQRPVEVKEA